MKRCLMFGHPPIHGGKEGGSPRGFTLIDLMVSIGILLILVAVSMPLVNGYLNNGQGDAAARDLMSSLRYAQMQSEANVDSNPWGVKVSSGAITIFRGSTYALRTSSYDQTVTFPTNIVVSGTSEYDFTQRTGRTTGGIITFTTPAGKATPITVNAVGMADY